MPPVRTPPAWVVARLRAAGCVAAEREAAELVAHAADDHQLERWIARRSDGEPLAWITGTTTFCGRPLVVTPGTYVPRPQSEDLARRAAAVLPGGGRALDLCTGSGAVAAHLAHQRPAATVIGVELDPGAAACARGNGVAVAVGDLDAPLGPIPFDVVTAVAPYVPTSALAYLPSDVRRHEPRRAHDGGDDGLRLVRAVAHAARRRLRPGGWLLVEVGGDQGGPLSALLDRLGFDRVEAWTDADGDLRGMAGRAPRA